MDIVTYALVQKTAAGLDEVKTTVDATNTKVNSLKISKCLICG